MSENSSNYVPGVYIEMAASDLDCIRQFYTKVFGWEMEPYGNDYVTFTDGKLRGGFFRGPVSPGGCLPVLTVQDVGAKLGEIQAAGGAVVQPETKHEWGCRAVFTDPEGNRLGLWSK